MQGQLPVVALFFRRAGTGACPYVFIKKGREKPAPETKVLPYVGANLAFALGERI